MLDSLTINFYDFWPRPATDSLLINQTREKSSDTLYIATSSEGFQAKGYYLPRAEIRKIRTLNYEGYSLIFCEIKGELGPKPDWVSREFFPHSYGWLCLEKI